MPQEMKVSVIVPVYRAEQYLAQCIDSILAQTYRNLEVILVDDGSPDRCPAMCDAYARQDPRVTVIHKENGGSSDARNFGIRKAAGDYVLFVDSDDYWDDPDCVRKLIERAALSHADVLAFAYSKYDEETGKTIPMLVQRSPMPPELRTKQKQLAYLSENGLYVSSPWSKLIRREVLLKTEFEKGRLAEDIAWSAQLLCAADSFDFLNLSFYCYRKRAGSVSQKKTMKTVQDLAYAVKACAITAELSEQDIRTYLGRYAAYQFSTFIAVQAFVRPFPKSDIRELKRYASILRYYAGSRKVKYMYYGVKLVGFANWCRLIRWTKPIWNTRRDLI